MSIRSFFRTVRSGIELCGRHPLLTGSIAILGLLGVALSIFGFQLDRQEAIETSEQISDLRDQIVRDDIFAWTSFLMIDSPYDYKRVNDLSYCSTRTEDFAIKADDFFDFLMRNQGSTVFLNFGVDLDECNIFEDVVTPQSTDIKLSLRTAHYLRFSSNIYEYKHFGLNPDYIEKSQNPYSPAFVVEFSRTDLAARTGEDYVATFWPPLDELQSFRYNADEYGLNIISGLFKIVISSASGAYAIELLPVEAVDFDKFSRTLQNVGDVGKVNLQY